MLLCTLVFVAMDGRLPAARCLPDLHPIALRLHTSDCFGWTLQLHDARDKHLEPPFSGSSQLYLLTLADISRLLNPHLSHLSPSETYNGTRGDYRKHLHLFRLPGVVMRRPQLDLQGDSYDVRARYFGSTHRYDITRNLASEYTKIEREHNAANYFEVENLVGHPADRLGDEQIATEYPRSNTYLLTW